MTSATFGPDAPHAEDINTVKAGPAEGLWSFMRVPLLVFAGYLIGAQVGFILRLPDTLPSVVWPPNAILTAALLLNAPRRWPRVLIAALAAHLIVELAALPPALALAYFITNCSEALMAAGLIRALSDYPSRFDTLRRVTAFLLGGALAAPFLSSFLDAGVAVLFGGEDYWAVWVTRFPSNALGAMAIVPALCGLFTERPRALTWPRRRWLDATGITVGIVLSAFIMSSTVGNAGFAPVPLTLFLPFLLWAAVKFGPVGAGLSLFAVVLFVVEAGIYGRGVLELVPADDRVRVLQLALIVMAVPLMCLAALVEERRRAEVALRASDVLKTAILRSLPSHVAVLNRDGRIIAVNESWGRFAVGAFGTADPPGVGTSYFQLVSEAPNGTTPGMKPAIEGIRGVLRGSIPDFAMKYSTRAREREAWWMVSVVPLKRAGGGAVVTHTDITDQHNAELEARRSREELAHLSRAFVVGELTASLSHQLNQPLTGIIGNAQAGRRFLDMNPPDLQELRYILTDIIADAGRAADLIRGIRDMLRKGSTEKVLIDVNDVVRETAGIVMSDAVIRNVSLHLALTPMLPRVMGDRVQLQQVILNILLNALEAMASRPNGQRVIRVRTDVNTVEGVVVSVHDAGPGLTPGAEELVFEPFYTTKSTGMGMGLSIARAIVEEHGGTIRATNHADGGAVFSLSVPVPVSAEPADAPMSPVV